MPPSRVSDRPGALLAFLVLGFALSSGCKKSDKPRTMAANQQVEAQRSNEIVVIDEPLPGPTEPALQRRETADHFAPASMPAAGGMGSGRAVQALPALGVPECDRLLKTLNECYMPRLTEPDQVRVLTTLKRQYKRWSDLAEEKTQHESLAADCRRAFEARAHVFRNAGCT